MKRLLLISISILALLALSACSAPATDEVASNAPAATVEKVAEGHECEACAKGEAGETVWCEKCGAGFVKGVKVACKDCYAAATAEKAGWCEHCKVGYVKGEKTNCKGCVEAAITGGECEACQKKKAAHEA